MGLMTVVMMYGLIHAGIHDTEQDISRIVRLKIRGPVVVTEPRF